MSTSATPVHTEDRAVVVTFKTVILSGPSKGNFVNLPDDDQVQFTVKSSIGRDGFTNELAQFCEISLLNVLLCFIQAYRSLKGVIALAGVLQISLVVFRALSYITVLPLC